MRAIDADALEKEGWSLHRTIQVNKNTSEYQIKPLKQVPTIEPEPCEDAVSRAELRKWIKSEANPYTVDNPKLDFNTSCLILEHLESMSSVMPKRKTGKWITKSTGGEMFDVCSICGHVEWDTPSKFCPDCGAKMEV